MHNSAAVPAVLPIRERVLIVSCILLITGLSWWYLIYLSHQMAGMEQEMMMDMDMPMSMPMHWRATDLAVTFLMWVVMMIGMMAASATPVLMLYRAAQIKRNTSTAQTLVAIFALGYLVAWTGFSALAVLLQWALHEKAMLSPSMSIINHTLSAGLLLTIGIYQLTAWKSACLQHCRSPLGFLMSNWRDGYSGALGMGLKHGIYCVGCCWAIMCILFVVGVMNLFWVAVLTGLVLLEKMSSKGMILARTIGVALIVLGIAKVLLIF